jgi:hypothetical protein
MKILKFHVSKKVVYFFLLTILTVGIVIFITQLYLSLEKFFYSWDYAAYQGSANGFLNILQQSKRQAINAIWNSLGTDYSILYTIPISPFMLLIGNIESRVTFITSLILVYFLPFVFVVGGIVRKIVICQSGRTFWMAVFITIATPAAWLPTLRGYPDTGGLVSMGLAIIIYIYDVQLKKWWQMVAIGFLLAATMMFRRHFIYGVIAFILAIGIECLLNYISTNRKKILVNWKKLAQPLFRILIINLICLAVLMTLGSPFLNYLFSRNFFKLYSAWQNNVSYVMSEFSSFYGALGILLAVSGIVIAIYKKYLHTRQSQVVLLFGILSGLIWTFWVRQVNPHYTVYYTLLYLIGLILCAYVVQKITKPALRVTGYVFFTLYLGINAYFWFFPAPKEVSPLFTASSSYLLHPNYDEVVRLVDFLRGVENENKTIYVVDSNIYMNSDLLAKAEKALYPGDLRLKVLHPPEVDTRDYYPIEDMLLAEYFLISTPLVHHIPINDQGIIKAVYDAFSQEWEFSKDFSPLPEKFSLRSIGDDTMTIYQRIAPTRRGTAIRTLKQIQDVVGDTPGSQPDWIRLDPYSIQKSSIGHPNGYSIRATVDANETLSFLYLGPHTSTVTITADTKLDLSTQCDEVFVSISPMDQTGDLGTSVEIKLDQSGVSNWAQEMDMGSVSYLMLQVTLPSELNEISSCSLVIENLQVISKQ